MRERGGNPAEIKAREADGETATWLFPVPPESEPILSSVPPSVGTVLPALHEVPGLNASIHESANEDLPRCLIGLKRPTQPVAELLALHEPRSDCPSFELMSQALDAPRAFPGYQAKCGPFQRHPSVALSPAE